MEPYTQVTCNKLIRFVLGMAVVLSWEIDQVDVKEAFLYFSFPKGEKFIVRLTIIDNVPSLSGQIVEHLRSLYRSY